MRGVIYNILWLLPMLISLSCAKEEVAMDSGVGVDRVFTIAATKCTDTAIDDGYELFDDGDAIRIGLFSYSSDMSSLEKYSNVLTTDIYAKYKDGDFPTWSYGYGREGEADNVAYKEITTVGATSPILAACYPYRDARDLKHIPFSLDDKQGLMWSYPVMITEENKNAVPLKFNHSMARINIKVDFKYLPSSTNDYPLRPNLFDLKVIGDTELVGSADYDSTNGGFDNVALVDSVSLITYSNIKNVYYDDYEIHDYDAKYDVTIYLVPERKFEGIDIRMSWEGGWYGSKFYPYDCIDGLMIGENQIQINNLGGTETTLKAGYVYNYTITINNSLKFEGITIDTGWGDDNGSYGGNI